MQALPFEWTTGINRFIFILHWELIICFKKEDDIENPFTLPIPDSCKNNNTNNKWYIMVWFGKVCMERFRDWMSKLWWTISIETVLVRQQKSRRQCCSVSVKQRWTYIIRIRLRDPVSIDIFTLTCSCMRVLVQREHIEYIVRICCVHNQSVRFSFDSNVIFWILLCTVERKFNEANFCFVFGFDLPTKKNGKFSFGRF